MRSVKINSDYQLLCQSDWKMFNVNEKKKSFGRVDLGGKIIYLYLSMYKLRGKNIRFKKSNILGS